MSLVNSGSAPRNECKTRSNPHRRSAQVFMSCLLCAHVVCVKSSCKAQCDWHGENVKQNGLVPTAPLIISCTPLQQKAYLLLLALWAPLNQPALKHSAHSLALMCPPTTSLFYVRPTLFSAASTTCPEGQPSEATHKHLLHFDE